MLYRHTLAMAVLLFLGPSDAVHAQWLTLRTQGIPRSSDGQVNLAAPPPENAGYSRPLGDVGLAARALLPTDRADLKRRSRPGACAVSPADGRVWQRRSVEPAVSTAGPGMNQSFLSPRR